MDRKILPPQNFPLMTFRGLKSSILTDYQTYRWFLYFISQKSQKTKAFADCQLARSYQEYHRLNILLRSINFLSFILLASLLHSFSLFRGISFLGFLALGVYKFHQKRRQVAEISLDLVRRDYQEPDLATMTLYSLTEILSRKYGLVSFVDALYHLERSYKTLFLLSFLLFGYVIYLDLWIWRILAFILFYFFAVFIANLPFFYRSCAKA